MQRHVSLDYAGVPVGQSQHVCPMHRIRCRSNSRSDCNLPTVSSSSALYLSGNKNRSLANHATWLWCVCSSMSLSDSGNISCLVNCTSGSTSLYITLISSSVRVWSRAETDPSIPCTIEFRDCHKVSPYFQTTLMTCFVQTQLFCCVSPPLTFLPSCSQFSAIRPRNT